MSRLERVARVLAESDFRQPDALVYRGDSGEQWPTWNEYRLEAQKAIAVHEAIVGETQ